MSEKSFQKMQREATGIDYDAELAALDDEPEDQPQQDAPIPDNPLCRGDGKCRGVCGGCLEMSTNLEYRMAFEIRNLRAALTQAQEALEDALPDVVYCLAQYPDGGQEQARAQVKLDRIRAALAATKEP